MVRRVGHVLPSSWLTAQYSPVTLNVTPVVDVTGMASLANEQHTIGADVSPSLADARNMTTVSPLLI